MRRRTKFCNRRFCLHLASCAGMLAFGLRAGADGLSLGSAGRLRPTSAWRSAASVALHADCTSEML